MGRPDHGMSGLCAAGLHDRCQDGAAIACRCIHHLVMATLADGRWHHVVEVRTASMPERYYIDGAAVRGAP